MEGQKLDRDIMTYYDVVEVENNSPKQDVRNLYVFKAVNTVKRITLVKIGYITTPKEDKSLFSTQSLSDSQLKQGLIENINKNF